MRHKGLVESDDSPWSPVNAWDFTPLFMRILIDCDRVEANRWHGARALY